MRKKIKNKKSKKAVSGIVATVLMIVVVIAVAGIISSLVFTTVTKLNSLSSACHALTNLQIKPDYTCKINVNGSELVEVMVEMPPNVESNLSGIAVKLNAYQFSKAIMITSGLSGYVWISLESLNTAIPTILPKKGQAITYVINATALGLRGMESVAVAPVVSNGKQQQTCTYGQVVKLRKCVEAPILQETASPGLPPVRPPHTCLVKGTKIMTINGERNIEDVKIGDLIIGFNERGNIQIVKVLKIYEHTTKGYYGLWYDDMKLFITGNHLIWSNGYRLVENIKVGDSLLYLTNIDSDDDAKLKIVKVKHIEFYNKTGVVYDIRTSGTHNFFADNILVHNKISIR